MRRPEKQRRAMFWRLKRGGGKRGDVRGPFQLPAGLSRLDRAANVAAAVFGAGVLAPKFMPLIIRVARRSGKIHPLKVIRAAKRLHPELAGVLEAAPAKRTLAQRLLGAGKPLAKWQRRKLRIVRAKGHSIPAAIPELEVAGIKGAQKVVVIGRKSKGTRLGHLGSSGVLAHELGHLADVGRGSVKHGEMFMPWSRLKEEWRATKVGSRIHKAAGGSRAAYWAQMLPALASYGGRNPAVLAGAAGLGAATWKKPKKRVKRPREHHWARTSGRVATAVMLGV